MIVYENTLVISRPMMKLLGMAGYRPDDLMYKMHWDDEEGKFITVDGRNEFCQDLEENSDFCFSSIKRKKNRFYLSLLKNYTTHYSEQTKQECSLLIEMAIPQSTGIAMEGKKAGDIFSGIEPISEERIKSVRHNYNGTEILLATKWLRLETEPPRRWLLDNILD